MPGETRRAAKKRSSFTNSPRVWLAASMNAVQSSAAHSLVDLFLRVSECILGLCLANQRGLDRGRHDLADRRPLRDKRTPIRIDIVAEGRRGDIDEIVAVAIHQLAVLRLLPERGPVNVGALVCTGEFVAGRCLRLL